MPTRAPAMHERAAMDASFDPELQRAAKDLVEAAEAYRHAYLGWLAGGRHGRAPDVLDAHLALEAARTRMSRASTPRNRPS